eukprot:SAG31_NODE_31581_length_366_cov_0.966292_1_plen_84_part_01
MSGAGERVAPDYATRSSKCVRVRPADRVRSPPAPRRRVHVRAQASAVLNLFKFSTVGLELRVLLNLIKGNLNFIYVDSRPYPLN